MIYFVTNEQRIFESFKIISVEESLRLLNTLSIVGVDTETKGLDPYTGTLLSLQLGCKEFQVVIDCTTIDIKKYKEFLESVEETVKNYIKYIISIGSVDGVTHENKEKVDGNDIDIELNIIRSLSKVI